MSIFKGLACLPPWRWLDGRRKRSIYFLAPCRPPGAVKSLGIYRPDRVAGHIFRREIPEIFFWARPLASAS
jgi:hypothetical protein